MNSTKKVSVTIDVAPANVGFIPDAYVVYLLAGIRRTGSINRSAKSLGLSYSTAWRGLREAEDGLGVKLLAPKKGGPGGGGTALTPEGNDLVERYLRMIDEAEQFVNACCRRYFPKA